MRPAEIHFIVAGPFPQRDIITLNLVRLAYRARDQFIGACVDGHRFHAKLPFCARRPLVADLCFIVSRHGGFVIVATRAWPHDSSRSKDRNCSSARHFDRHDHAIDGGDSQPRRSGHGAQDRRGSLADSARAIRFAAAEVDVRAAEQ